MTETQIVMPCLSVIIPVYNAALFLPECLNSLLAQNLADMEIICVNDGSNDDSGDILNACQSLDRRIKIHTIDNQGPGKARNIGQHSAKGDYIAFLDADDFVSSNYYEILLDIASKHEADISLSTNVVLIENGIPQGSKNIGPAGNVILTTNQEKKHVFINSGVIWNKIFNTNFMRAHGLQNSETRCLGEDNFLNIASAIAANKIVCSNMPVHYYRQGRNSLAHAAHTETHYKIVYVYRDTLAYLQNMHLSSDALYEWRAYVFERMDRDFRRFLKRFSRRLKSGFMHLIQAEFPDFCDAYPRYKVKSHYSAEISRTAGRKTANSASHSFIKAILSWME